MGTSMTPLCPLCGRRLYVTPSGAVRCEEWSCSGTVEHDRHFEKRHPELVIEPGDVREFGKLIKKAATP